MAHEIEVIVRAPAAGGNPTVARIVTDAINRLGWRSSCRMRTCRRGSTPQSPPRSASGTSTRPARRSRSQRSRRRGRGTSAPSASATTSEPRTCCRHTSSPSHGPATNACVTRAHPARTLPITNEDEHMTFVNSEAEFAAAVEVWSLWLALEVRPMTLLRRFFRGHRPVPPRRWHCTSPSSRAPVSALRSFTGTRTTVSSTDAHWRSARRRDLREGAPRRTTREQRQREALELLRAGPVVVWPHKHFNAASKVALKDPSGRGRAVMTEEEHLTSPRTSAASTRCAFARCTDSFA